MFRLTRFIVWLINFLSLSPVHLNGVGACSSVWIDKVFCMILSVCLLNIAQILQSVVRWPLVRVDRGPWSNKFLHYRDQGPFCHPPDGYDPVSLLCRITQRPIAVEPNVPSYTFFLQPNSRLFVPPLPRLQIVQQLSLTLCIFGVKA